MLAYAPRPERRRFSPAALALIAGLHGLAILAALTARMAFPDEEKEPPLIVDTVLVPPEPVADPRPRDPARPPDRSFDAPKPLLNPLPAPGPLVDPLPLPPDPGRIIGPGVQPMPDPPLVRTGPRFATPEGDVRPPYPESKRERDQEAVLRLRLAIDERGRVTVVEPVGNADPVFLAAARRHILRAWRYKPATEGERAIASSTVITLEFRLD